jgi:hypothetical protein
MSTRLATDRLLRPRVLRGALLPALCLPLAAAAQEAPFVWEEELAAGTTLAAHTVNGTVTVRGGSGRVARVTGTRRPGDGRAAAGQEIRFETRRAGNTVIVCALYVEGSSCDADGIRSGSWQGNRRPERADLVVELPAGVHLQTASGNGAVTVGGATGDVRARSGNGDVRVGAGTRAVTAVSGNGRVSVEGASAPVTARSGNGRVEVVTSVGPVRATTGNGNILVRMAALGEEGEMEFRSGNGSITLELPRDFRARVSASTGRGEVESDFPVQIEAGALRRGRLEGVIGDGGPRVRLQTGNGRIRLRQLVP